ncbi:MAG: DUF3830 family protein [Chloroflexota bacterium]|nr:DUF3830 family protein [Chloroflexota bacterium]MDE3193667.1 DUF3830 family protein [Chloroflexota bacterium]
MGKRISITVGDLRTEATLYEERAPKAIAALWQALPLRDKTVQVRWSGNAWRTEGDYGLLPKGTPCENLATRLSAGDIIYFPPFKVGVAYGPAQWLNPFMEPVDVSLLGKIDKKLEEFNALCGLILYRGPLPIEIARID